MEAVDFYIKSGLRVWLRCSKQESRVSLRRKRSERARRKKRSQLKKQKKN